MNSLSDVPVTWTALSGSPAPTGYFVTRTSGGSTVAACASSASTLLTGTSCTDLTVPDGAYTYTVTAKYRSWTAASAPSGGVTVWTPTKLAVTGQPTTTIAGTAITPAVTVTVQTNAGVAVPLATSVDIAIGANPGGGTLSPTATVTATTDSSGVATFAGLSINKAGAGYTLTATSSGLTSATSGAFTVSPATADRFVITSTAVSGTAASTATLGPITVERQDPLGNPAAPASAVTVNLSSSSTGASFKDSVGATTSTVTIPAGTSSATFLYGDTKSGTPTVTASGALASATQTATIAAGTATKFAITSPAISNGAASISATLGPLTVTRQDALGNAATGGALTVTLASSSAGPAYLSATPGATTTSTVTIPSGQTGTTFYYGDTKPGSPTITASGTLTSGTQGQSIVAGPAYKLAIPSGNVGGVASATAVRGATAVHVRDIADNPVTTGAVVSLSSNTAGTAIFATTAGGTGVSTITIAPGQSSTVFYYGDTKATPAGTVTVTAAVAGLTSATASGTVTADVATHLEFVVRPSNTNDGSTITPAVTARTLDQFNNQATNTVSVTISIDHNAGSFLGLGAGILDGTLTRSTVGGVATFNDLSIDGFLGIGGTGTGYTLKVTGVGSAVESAPFNIF